MKGVSHGPPRVAARSNSHYPPEIGLLEEIIEGPSEKPGSIVFERIGRPPSQPHNMGLTRNMPHFRGDCRIIIGVFEHFPQIRPHYFLLQKRVKDLEGYLRVRHASHRLNAGGFLPGDVLFVNHVKAIVGGKTVHQGGLEIDALRFIIGAVICYLTHGQLPLLTLY